MNKAVDLGLLVIRLSVGGSILVFRGFANLAGGNQVWSQNGSFIFETGINLSPEMVGLILAVIECLGGLMLITGALFRTGGILLAITVLPSLLYQVSSSTSTSYIGLESSFVSVLLLGSLVGLIISGPGSIAMHPFRRTAGESSAQDPLPDFESLS